MRGFGSDFPGANLPHGVKWWPGVSNVLEPVSQELIQIFKDAWENDPVRPLLETLARLDGNIPCYAIRVGDVCDPSRALGGEGLAVGATLAASFLAYLKNTTIGLADDSNPRYTQHPIGAPHTWGGYRVDDWISAALHYFVFVARREKVRSGIFGRTAPKESAENTRFVWVFDDVLDPPDVTDATAGVAAGTPAKTRGSDLDYLKNMLRSARAVKAGMRKGPMTHKEFIMRSCAKPDIFSPIDRKVQLVEAANSRYKPANWVLPKVDVDCLDMFTQGLMDDKHGANFKQPQEHHPADNVDELLPGNFADDFDMLSFKMKRDMIECELLQAEQGMTNGPTMEDPSDEIAESMFGSTSHKLLTQRTQPFGDTSMTEAQILVEGLLLTKRMVGDFSIHDFESMVIDSNLEDPDKFDLAMLAKKYHWAVNWDLAGSLTGKSLLPHQIIGRSNFAPQSVFMY